MLQSTTTNPLQMHHVPALEARLNQVRTSVANSQETYRSMGIRFHSLSPSTRANKSRPISSYVDIFTDHFTVSQDTPEMVLVLQDVVHAMAEAGIRSTISSLHTPYDVNVNGGLLADTEAALDEAETLLMSLQADFEALERGIHELESRDVLTEEELHHGFEDDSELQAWMATLQPEMPPTTTNRQPETQHFPNLQARIRQLKFGAEMSHGTFGRLATRHLALSPSTRADPANSSYADVFRDWVTGVDYEAVPEMMIANQNIMRMAEEAEAALQDAAVCTCNGKHAELAEAEARIEEAETLLLSMQIKFEMLERGIHGLESKEVEGKEASQNETEGYDDPPFDATGSEVQAMLDSQLGVTTTSDTGSGASSVTLAAPTPTHADTLEPTNSPLDAEDLAILDNFISQNATKTNAQIGGMPVFEDDTIDTEMPDFEQEMADVPDFGHDLGGSFDFDFGF